MAVDGRQFAAVIGARGPMLRCVNFFCTCSNIGVMTALTRAIATGMLQ
jgi:hypothetical protein